MQKIHKIDKKRRFLKVMLFHITSQYYYSFYIYSGIGIENAEKSDIV